MAEANQPHPRSELDEKLIIFLQNRRTSAGGYAKVETKDLSLLRDVIQQLLLEKFEVDPDGDLPINVKIIDRTMFEPIHYQPVPYYHKAIDALAKTDRLKVLATNLKIAANSLWLHISLEEE